MKLHIYEHSDHFSTEIKKINWNKLENSLNLFLKIKKIDTFQGWIEVNFQTDETIKEINKNLRNKDKTTDVLSWNMTTDNQNTDCLVGEIHISDKYVSQKCLEKNLKIDEELIFLIVHGFLHILGYDHNNDDEETEMNNETLTILEDLGIDYSLKLL